MHELGITRNIVEIVSQQAAGQPVSRVRLAIGNLTAVVPDALHFCFDVVTQGTVLQGARLEIDSIEGRALCESCGAEYPMPLTGSRCGCGSADYQLLAGEELKIVEMETH